MIDNPAATIRRKATGIGGHLALDFANTAGWHLAANPVERLRSWRDVVGWAEGSDLIDPSQAELLASELQPTDKIIRLREDIFALALAAARSVEADGPALKRVSAAAEQRGPRAIAHANALRWALEPSKAAEQLATLLARSALDLLCSANAARIRLCEGDECGWVFIDDSRSGRRRWCSMTDCGARAKARRHYQRAKLGSSSAAA
jgi:predicted RNA-binding Zn ribbon-like protein